MLFKESIKALVIFPGGRQNSAPKSAFEQLPHLLDVLIMDYGTYDRKLLLYITQDVFCIR